MFNAIPPCEQKWVHSFIALQIPKSASSSIEKCCRERNLIQKHHGLFQAIFGKNPLYKGVFDTRHVSPPEIFRIFGSQVFDYFSFAITRNPFRRVESAYLFGKKKKLHNVYGLSENCSFEQFIDFLYESWEAGRQDILLLRNQTEWTHSPVFKPTEILKLENLETEWPKMLDTYGIKGLPSLTRENATDRSQPLIWGKDSKERAIKMFESEFDLLGYSKTFA